ncbi:hypothetical protein CathTA2_2943 [Caldalkalibacillus thermarum TA2.A1]|uniref:Uncharacterized protein n=1 Tax=Caldalkalibacillus thermarum (strain TA2.A1) TaxID=986075 RepID=F5LAK8_CALTT|nr:hypothetical protein [Caldalkalibacillus thermarum]EGL81580.1 hypothetical protein CathTA2_2943 [Caldalkalibacillus thermarum TA2.A1]QZT33529.1 hypothetical protein HUR95_14980 [Caldalkalibacillus thermarum TA2.A1]
MTRLLFASPELEAVSQAYHFQVYQVQRTADGFILETDCGPKSVTEIKDPEALKWSYHWREAAVRRGFRQVDRFILTRCKSAYLSTPSGYLVVKDRLRGEPVDFSRPEAWQALGTCTALIHRAVEDALKLPFALETVEIPAPLLSFGELEDLKHRVETKQSNLASLILEQWPLLDERWRAAVQLYHFSEPVLSQMLSLPCLKYTSWKVVAGCCLAFEGPLEKPVLGLKALAQLMQEIWLRFGADESQLETFFTAFEHGYQLSTYALHHLLAHLVYPDRLYTFLQSYVESEGEEASREKEWERLTAQQAKLDRLHLWVARQIDKRREAALSYVAD